jgi:hypothetical protein
MMLFGEAVLPSLARYVPTVMSFSTRDHVMAVLISATLYDATAEICHCDTQL